MFQIRMSSSLIGLFALSSVLIAEEPRNVIERAIKAQGGQAVVSRSGIFHAKIKGVFPELQADFTGDLYSEPPTRYKLDIDVELKQALCQKKKFIDLLNGDQGFSQDETGTKPNPQLIDEGRLARAMVLVPLLDEKEYKLVALPDAKIGDRPVAEVKLMKGKESDIVLSFDKESGLLVKTRLQRTDTESGKPSVQEMFLSDYREVNPASADEAVLKQAKIDTTDAGLIDFLKRRTLSEEQRVQIQKLIKQLGESDFDKREGAKKELIAKGTLVIGALNEALKNSDAEIVSGARECLTAIDKGAESKLIASVARLLGSRVSQGTVKALLDYLPYAADDITAGEVRGLLDDFAFSGDKPGKELEQALQDKDQQVREAAQAIVEAHGKKASQKPGQRWRTPGLKVSVKRSEFKDGKKEDEWEITEIAFFNRLEDRIFAKP